MKISLVIPDFLSGTSFLQQPLDLLYLTTCLREQNHIVSIVDCRIHHLTINHTIEKIKDSELIVVATTPIDQVQNYFIDYRYAYTILTINEIRKSLPDKILAVYGAHVTVRPDLVIKEINADIYIVGEVYAPIMSLVRFFNLPQKWQEIPNIIINNKEKFFRSSIDSELMHPKIPDEILPAYDAVEMHMYFGVDYYHNIPIIKQRRAVMSAGRGCPYSCTFCHNYFGKKINQRNVETVVQELKLLIKDYNVKEIFFLDEVFTLNRQWVYNLRDQIVKNGIKIDITIQTRVDCLDKDIIKALKDMGVGNIWLGVESADDSILSDMNKGTNIDIINQTIDDIRSHNIIPNAFFMIGVPGETLTSINKLISEIYYKKIPYTRSIMVCTPRYGTEYYKLAEAQYPEIRDNWFNLNKVKGLVANNMTPELLGEIKQLFRNRDFIYDKVCPTIKDNY